MRVYRSFATVAPQGLGFRSSWDVSVSDDNAPRLRLIVPKETSFRASYPMNADAHDRALKIISPEYENSARPRRSSGKPKIEGSTAR
jgi:hypothetical protein